MEILRLNLDNSEKPPSESEIKLQIALLSAIAAVGASLIARFVFDAPLLPELLAQFIFAVAPIWAVEMAVGMLGPFAKHLAFIACVVVYLLALIFAALACLKFVHPQSPSKSLNASVAILGAAYWAVAIFGIIPALDGGIAGKYLRQGATITVISQFIVAAFFAVALRMFARMYLEKGLSDDERPNLIGRRRAVRAVGYAVLLAGVYDIGKSLLVSWLNSGSGRVRKGDGIFPNIDNLALEVTPTKDFYEVSKNAFDPEVDSQRWKLEIGGLVENPIFLNYDEIKSLPSVEQYATLACISNEVGGDLIGNALWRGVRMKDLLERAGLKPGVVDIVLRARDDYTDSIPLERAMNEATLLVYEMNGEPLTPTHGFPLRLIVPGIYGMKNVKWITRIEAIDYDLKGYWQRRGWDDRAEYKTMSRIDAPDGGFKSETTIAGIAFAGDRGISKVELSTDGGKSWEQAEIKPPLSANAWTLWNKRWRPEQPGAHKLIVRATDGRGIAQTPQYAPPAPSGSSGYHSKTAKSE